MSGPGRGQRSHTWHLGSEPGGDCLYSPQGEAVPRQQRARARVHTSVGSDSPPKPHITEGAARPQPPGQARPLSSGSQDAVLVEGEPAPGAASPPTPTLSQYLKQEAASCSREAHRGCECEDCRPRQSLPGSQGEGGLITGVQGTPARLPARPPGLPQSPCISQSSPLHSILK